jgi:hypothetical protein
MGDPSVGCHRVMSAKTIGASNILNSFVTNSPVPSGFRCVAAEMTSIEISRAAGLSPEASRGRNR